MDVCPPDDLSTVNHNLHVQQLQQAEWSQATQQWHVVLSCGHFTYGTQPPFHIQWQVSDPLM